MDDEEAECVEQWNLELFDELGFNVEQAQALVAARVSPHDVERQLKRGCTRDAALLIFL